MSWNPPPPNGQQGMMPGPPVFQSAGQYGGPPMGPPANNLQPMNQPRLPPVMNPMNGLGQFNSGPPKPGPPPSGPLTGASSLGNLPPRPQMMPNGPQFPHMGGPPPSMAPGAPDSPQIARPPPAMTSLQPSGSGSELLPAPYHGKGIYSQTTHVGPPHSQNITPTNSEPTSLNTSRVPSPIPTLHFDALEGQFRSGTPTSALGTPPSGSPVPNSTPSPRGGPRPLFPQPHLQGPASAHSQPPVNFSIGPPTSNAQSPNGAPPLGPPTMNNQFQPPTSGMAPLGQFQSHQPRPGMPPPQGNQPQPGMPTQPPRPMGQFQGPSPGQFNPQPVTGGFGQPAAMPSAAPPHYPPVVGPAQNNMYGGGGLNNQFGGMGIQQQHQIPNEMRVFNLLQERNLLSNEPVRPSVPNLPEHMKKNNCSPDIMRCTLNAMPQSNSILQKCRLPLGILIHPFKDLSSEDNSCSSADYSLSEDEGETVSSYSSPSHMRYNTTTAAGMSPNTTTTAAALPYQSYPAYFFYHESDYHLPVIQSSVIVRCRSCRTYINPFVTFVDQRRWRCNLCFRANELPEEFNFDPVSKSYGSPERRPEIKSATIEFVAPSEYMLRPPQPCVYLFLLDVSYNALQTGYLQSFCEVLSEEIDKIPGDSRTLIGFITYNSSVHFYNLSEDLSTPQIHIVSDVDDIFLPLPEGLLASLQSSKELVEQLLEKLPTYHQDEFYKDDNSAMGAAMQAALKMLAATGGRITVVQTSLPNCGPGKLTNREDPNQRASSKPANLPPATDFYKLLSLEAAGQQIAIDMFLLNGQYADHATIGGAARHSGGSIYSYPGLNTMHNPMEVERFESDLKRYLTRKIGLEAVMRVRCTKGLAIHSFHGNFFVRSTDLLSLPNINPDAGFGMQVSIEENLTDSPYACMQAALLYTSSKGERRIRVHTLCLPVTNSITDIINSADQQAVVGLLSKMAVDRSINSAVSDAREALVNAVVDALGAYGGTLGSQQRMGALPAPYSLRLLPLYVSAVLKHPSIRIGVSTKTDDRVDAMDECKTLPLSRLMQKLTPDLYPVHALNDEGGIERDDGIIPQPPRLALSSGSMDRHGAFLLDRGTHLYLWIGSNINPDFCQDVFGVSEFHSIQDGLIDLPENDNDTSDRLRLFISHLQESRPNLPPLLIIRDDSRNRQMFIEHMIEDKTESSMSYYEFLQHIQKNIKS